MTKQVPLACPMVGSMVGFLAGGEGCPSSSGPEGGAPAENKPSAGHAGTGKFSPRGTYHTV